MKCWKFKGVLTPEKWLSPGYLITEGGKIKQIGSSVTETVDEEVDGFLIPGFQNAHSHAFQYAMAGIAENRSKSNPQDDFWSWRETMYRIALEIGPDQLRNIATTLYSEMVRNGYTSVAEFHYLQHQKNGQPYENPAEMSLQLVEAARTAGINITLVPVYYHSGGFGKVAQSQQRRFIFKDPDHYQNLWDSAEKIIQNYEGGKMGMGIHSIRAANKEQLEILVKNRKKGLPFHLHISEQQKEVHDCLEYYGKRPVEWFFDIAQPDNDFHFVHATHLDTRELKMLATSNASVILCPSTEANLGDGIFPLSGFQELGGNWSIGTDSHIGLNPLEELRLLDYGQRLFHQKRNTWHQASDNGRYAIEMAWNTGLRVMGRSSAAYFGTGSFLEGVVIDAQLPLLQDTSAEHLLNTMIYIGNSEYILGTLIRGEWKWHKDKMEELINNRLRFSETLKSLNIR
jgi:formimidoylglutamate deiminase